MTKSDNNGEGAESLWKALWRPRVRYAAGALLAGMFVAGILFWGGYNWAMELTNTESFCISCHEMKDNVYSEMKKTVHYSNSSGVRAICSDCHVPKPWFYKLVRKIQATNELYHKIFGTIDTREKFLAKRMDLAKHVWASMRKTDSRECRNCHSMDSMKLETQVRPAQNKHKKAVEKGMTCIDCHQGIAHELPEGWKAAWAEVAGPAAEEDSEDSGDSSE